LYEHLFDRKKLKATIVTILLARVAGMPAVRTKSFDLHGLFLIGGFTCRRGNFGKLQATIFTKHYPSRIIETTARANVASG
jgi:hypothetical protein